MDLPVAGHASRHSGASPRARIHRDGHAHLVLGIGASTCFLVRTIGEQTDVASTQQDVPTSEIGVRTVLGAQRNDVLWATVRRSLAWIAAGIAVGIPLALSTSRVAQGLLFGLSANDAGTFIVATIVMIMVGLLAACIPARRASRIDPLIALRAE